MITAKLRSSYVLAAVLVAALSGCKGAAGPVVPSAAAPNAVGQQSTMMAAPAEPEAKTFAAVILSPGAVVGTDNLFTPKSGDSKHGGHGQLVDGIPCKPTEYINQYHIHAYVGLIVNGRQIAIPNAIGMKKPSVAVNGFNESAKCYYYIHTHDASGTIHVEVPRNLPPSASIYNVGNLLDIWGLQKTHTSFGPFTGNIQVFVGNVPLKQTLVTKYAAVTKSLASIKLRSHEVIWIVIGKKPMLVSKLPSVTFYTEY